MRRLFKGAVLGLALALLAVSQPAQADGAGEVLLERSRLTDLKASGRWLFRGQVGAQFLDRDFAGEDFNNINVQFGLTAYHGYFFLRADGNLNVSDDDNGPYELSSNGYSFAGGVQQPLGRDLVGGAWIGYARFNTKIDSPFGDATLGLSGPYVGAGINYQFRHRGAPGRLSAFLGGRFYFATSTSDDLDDLGADADNGWEIAGGLRYHFTSQMFVTGGAAYRNFGLDGVGGDDNVRDIVPFVNVGINFR